MERLTERTEDGNLYLTPEPETDVYGNYTEKGYEQLDVIYNRLAAYEDTGLTPEEINVRLQRKHDCKIECLLDEYNKVVEERDKLKERQRWVPVSKKTPKENGRYYCYDQSHDWKFIAAFQGGRTWEVDSNMAGSALLTVTHWMPLPKAPEADR